MTMFKSFTAKERYMMRAILNDFKSARKDYITKEFSRENFDMLTRLIAELELQERISTKKKAMPLKEGKACQNFKKVKEGTQSQCRKD